MAKNYQLPPRYREFEQTFNSLVGRHRAYTLFNDFITMSAISLHNAVNFTQQLEDEYLTLTKRYNKDELNIIAKMFAQLIDLVDTPEPHDTLGEMYMGLDFGNAHNGQFFTPFELSFACSEMVFDEEVFKEKPFVTVSDPASGSGGMILAFIKSMRRRKLWQDRVFASCVDIERLASLMCYIQLSLWHAPAEIVVGNSLTMDFREVWYTPAYYLGNWEHKLKQGNRPTVKDESGTEVKDIVLQSVKTKSARYKQKIQIEAANKKRRDLRTKRTLKLSTNRRNTR
jgi:type I restriction-modification system DNA methylase subunit